MGLVPKNGIANVIKVGNPAAVEEQAVLQFTGVPDHTVVADDHVFTDIGTVPDFAILTDPRRTFDRYPVFQRRAFPDVDVFSDPRRPFAGILQLGLQVFRQVALELPQSRPRMLTIVKYRGMLGLAEIEEIFGFCHQQRLRKNG